MIVKPTVLELLEKAENRYSLVIATAKRARQIANGSIPMTSSDDVSPVTLAADEIEEDKVKIYNKNQWDEELEKRKEESSVENNEANKNNEENSEQIEVKDREEQAEDLEKIEEQEELEGDSKNEEQEELEDDGDSEEQDEAEDNEENKEQTGTEENQ